MLQDNPSLRPRLPELGEEGYRRGIQLAVRETTIDKKTFPATFEKTGWAWEQVLNFPHFCSALILRSGQHPSSWRQR